MGAGWGGGDLSILILGLGNILLGDEGVGVRAVEALARHPDLPTGVEVVDGGTAGMSLIDILASRERVIVIDAVRSGEPPGTVVRLDGDDVPAFFRTRISPHQLGLSEVLAALTLTNELPKRVTLIGVEPLDLGLGLTLTPVVAGVIDRVVEMVLAELEAAGDGSTAAVDAIA